MLLSMLTVVTVRGVGFPRRLSVHCSTQYLKTDIKMFHRESRKLMYFGVKMSKVKVTRHRKQ